MATDAVIQFLYSNDVPLVAIYKRYDSSPQDVAKALKKYLADTQNVQWDFMVADLISRFVDDSLNRKGIKMLYRMPLKKDNSFIYLWQIFPKEDDYRNSNIPFERSIYVNVWRGNMKELIYNGPLVDLKING